MSPLTAGRCSNSRGGPALKVLFKTKSHNLVAGETLVVLVRATTLSLNAQLPLVECHSPRVRPSTDQEEGSH